MEWFYGFPHFGEKVVLRKKYKVLRLISDNFMQGCFPFDFRNGGMDTKLEQFVVCSL